MEFNFKSYDNSKQAISYCEVDKCKAVIKLQDQLNTKEQECEELKNFHINLVGVKECEIKELLKLKQTLTEIKPILEFYANSKMGEEQPDRTYKIMLSGGYVMVYDPKPARQALQKISEVE